MEILETDQQYEALFARVKEGSRKIAQLDPDIINHILTDLADAIIRYNSQILSANERDLSLMNKDDPKYDRLLLTEDRIISMAKGVRQVAALPSPLSKIISNRTLPNGLELSKVSIPLGVIGVIYEARPNVTVDVFALCLKSGNACILKGGSDAYATNIVLVEIISNVLKDFGMDSSGILLLPPGRAETHALLQAIDYVDAVIPRGSQELINYVRKHARVPVIVTGAGVVHVYFDEEGDLELGKEIILNAKTRKVSACNSLDTLLVNRKRLSSLPCLLQKLIPYEVNIHAPVEILDVLRGHYPATLLHEIEKNGYATEYLSYGLSIGIVDHLDQAIVHINTFSARNSEAIITKNPKAATLFQQQVDAAVVYVNASTAFTDGAEFGLGAEIGISTQKLHASGPMGLEEIIAYKWMVNGTGQVRI